MARSVARQTAQAERATPYLFGRPLAVQLRALLYYLVAFSLLAIFVIPFIWTFGSAFRPVPEIFKYAYPLSIRTFVPVDFTVQNFTDLLLSKGSLWPRYIFNSVFVAIATVILGVFVNALAAYGFARLRFPGRDGLFLLVLLTIIIPFEAIALPLFFLVKEIGWIDTYQALIVPAVANGFNIFLLRQFFMLIPHELEESALVDGASRLRIFWQIAVPLTWPAIISTALMAFQASWDAFIWPLIVTNSAEVRVLQIGVATLVGQDAIYWNLIFAAVALSAAVPIVIFAIFQRYYTEASLTSGLKM